jgi:hypothetical protein
MNEKPNAADQGTASNQHAPEIQAPKPAGAIPYQPTAEQKLDKVEREMGGFELASLKWTRATFFILAVTCLFIGFQWHEMRSGSADTHTLAEQAKRQAEKLTNMSDAAEKIRQASENMVIQNKRIADNAQKAIEISNRQSKQVLDATISNTRLQERAWLTASSLKLSEEPALNKGFTVTIGVSNTGRTPALDVSNECRLSVWNVDPSPANFNALKPVSKGILAPGNNSVSFTCVPATLTTSTQIDAYTSKAIRIYVEAMIRYTDTFKRVHWTKVCVYHTFGMPLDTFPYCERGNEIDQDNENPT